MKGPPNRSARRVRAGLTMVELLMALAALGVLGVLALSYQVPAPPVRTPPPLSIEAPSPPVCPRNVYYGERSLQDTLDRLGYTVNVPHEYRGHTIASLGSRVSTADDSVDAGRFTSDGPVTFQEVSRQSALGSSTTFAAEDEQGGVVTLLKPAGGRWAGGNGHSRTATCNLSGVVRLSIDFPANNGFTHGPLYSTAADNPRNSAQLIVLPARKGGAWVDEGGDRGHWEGGEDSGEYLLCWEDMAGGGDCDFQDLVILTRGLVPADTD
jgi:hypothetical protein